MKLFSACKLTHTLQTWLGMVTDNGEPRVRSSPSIPHPLIDNDRVQVLVDGPRSLSEEGLVYLFTSCVLECRLPQFRNTHDDDDVKRLKANIHGCCDKRIDIAFVKRNIDSLLRLDLEQAAAVVISVIRNDESIANRSNIVQSLLKEIHPTVISNSCMWVEYSHTSSAIAIQARKFSHLVARIRHVIQDKHMVDMGDIHDWSSLIRLLLRIRRCSPTFSLPFHP